MNTDAELASLYRPRKRLAPVLVALLCLATFPTAWSGCRAIWDSPDVKIELTDADLAEHPNYSGNTRLLVGATLTVALFSNGTTGFSWTNPAELSDPTILSQSSHEYVPPPIDNAGAGGKEVWTLKALKRGECTVHLEYRKPFESGTPPSRTFSLSVSVY